MPPTPEARAIADRFMFDTGNLKYLATQLPKGALDRPVPGPGWTVRQGLAHLADGQEVFAGILEGLRRGEQPDPGLFDLTAHNAEVTAKNRETPLPRILEAFDASIRRLVAALVEVDDAASQAKLGMYDLVDALHAWSNHASRHGMEMLDVLPELRDDAMMLNWLLYEDFSDSPEHLERQQRLYSEVRERYGDEDDDDDEVDV